MVPTCFPLRGWSGRVFTEEDREQSAELEQTDPGLHRATGEAHMDEDM